MKNEERMKGFVFFGGTDTITVIEIMITNHPLSFLLQFLTPWLVGSRQLCTSGKSQAQAEKINRGNIGKVEYLSELS